MAFKPRKKLKIIVVIDADFNPPPSLKGLSEKEIRGIQNEYDVITNLKQMGHDVETVQLRNDVREIRKAIEQFHPDIAFNLIVELHGYSMFEPHLVSYLELLKQPYTGCNPRGLMLAHDKALSKKILAYHRIPVPEFAVFPRRLKVRKPSKLRFPLMVKSLVEQGSAGISQASVVYDEDALAERVDFIHRKVQSHAIAEEFIEGRELYVAMIGNHRLQPFSPWELIIANLPEGVPYIATSKIKWDPDYQKKVGLETRSADLEPETQRRLEALSRRIYRVLSLSGYARLDFRLSQDGKFYFLEANPNPDISFGEDFAEAAEHSGIHYEELLQKILNLGLHYHPIF